MIASGRNKIWEEKHSNSQQKMRNIPPQPSSSQHQKEEEEEKKTKVAKTPMMSQYENKRRINSAYHCYRK